MKKVIITLFTIFPLVTFARDLGKVVDSALMAIDALIPLIIGLALLAFMWGLVTYIWRGDDTKSREEGQQFMLWGIVGLTVMVSFWALIAIMANVFNMHIPFSGSTTLPNKQF